MYGEGILLVKRSEINIFTKQKINRIKNFIPALPLCGFFDDSLASNHQTP